MKDEVIPFIGDIFLTERGIFQGSCVNGSLPVCDLNIQDNIFEVEVNLRSRIDQSQLDEKGAHVIIGIDVEIKAKDDVVRPVSVRDSILKEAEKVILPCGVEVLPGKFKIVEFHLVPIEYVEMLVDNNDLNCVKNQKFNFLDIENINVFQELNDCIEEVKRMANDNDVLSVMSQVARNKLKDIQKILINCKQNFSLECFHLLRELNSSNWAKNIHTLIVGTELCRELAENSNQDLQAFKTNLKGKMAFLELLRGMGIRYVSDSRNFNRAIREKECFAIFFNEDLVKNNPGQFRKAIEFFKELLEGALESGRQNQEFIAVDLDVIPGNELRVPVPKKVVIYHSSYGELLSLDLMSDFDKKSAFNTAKCGKPGQEDEPKRRGKFRLPCPNSVRGDCSKTYHEWLCKDCNTYFDYGFNDCLYCNCNDQKGTRLSEFKFRCSDMRHGFDYVKFFDRCKDYFDQIEPMENISVIILGQSGVGKSTWINGMINYILYNDIQVAKESNIVTAIPTKFTITDQYYHTQLIEIGNDENEDTGTVGAAGTQDCRTYNIRYSKNNKDYNIQLIDTPGLGDNRGIEQDRKNVKKILDHIRHFDEIHGFCILLKPNESKIGVLLRFCIKEILTHLHKSCADNIVYCFTNARCTFYRPGDTLPVLRALLEEIQVHMRLHRDTIYCFDNEAYRYLCTFNRKNVIYTKEDEKSFEESWDKSVTETKRLLDYVIGLRPHRTQETLTLNQSRRLILSLTRPIADITHNIEMNIQIVSDHKDLIESMDERDKDLLKNLYVPQVTLENVPLGFPRTVCTADSCVHYHTLNDLQLAEYVTHCHPHCYLQGVTAEQYPNPDLRNCAAMSLSGGETCAGCKCSWKTHMHIVYDQRRTEIRVKNQSIELNKGNKADLRKEKEQAIDDLESQITRLKDEKKKIIQIAGKFAYFLKKHAITPYNDCFCDYLDYLIDHEEGKRYKTEKEKAILDNLKKTKASYEEEIKFLETAMMSSTDTGHYDPADVEAWKEELYSLPIHGQQLRDNMKVVLEAEDKAARHFQRTLAPSKKNPPSTGFLGFAKKNPSSTGFFGSAVNSVIQTVQSFNPFSSNTSHNNKITYRNDFDDFENGNPNHYGNRRGGGAGGGRHQDSHHGGNHRGQGQSHGQQNHHKSHNEPKHNNKKNKSKWK